MKAADREFPSPRIHARSFNPQIQSNPSLVSTHCFLHIWKNPPRPSPPTQPSHTAAGAAEETGDQYRDTKSHSTNRARGGVSGNNNRLATVLASKLGYGRDPTTHQQPRSILPIPQSYQALRTLHYLHQTQVWRNVQQSALSVPIAPQCGIATPLGRARPMIGDNVGIPGTSATGERKAIRKAF